MSFPSPSLPAPALGLYQFSFNDLAFGGIVPSTPYQLKDIAIGGIDLSAIQSGDLQRPLDDGEFAGVDVAQGRDIPIDLTITADSTSLDHARQALGGAFAPAGATEAPLFLTLPSGTFATMCRPRKLAYAIDINTVLAKGTPANVLLHSTDPRWYASPSKSATTGLPSTTGPGGLAFPVSFPASFGSGSVGGLLDVWNLGTVAMFPTLLFTGPCTNPSAANLSLPGAPALTFDITLNAGDTLLVDTDFQTVTYTTAGSTAGSPRANTEAYGSTWWNLAPANGPRGIGAANVIEFSTADPTAVAGTLTVASADAYAAL